jgi:hypothetical protein
MRGGIAFREHTFIDGVLIIVIDAVVHSEHAQVIKCNFKPGSIERSIHYWSLRGF